MVEDFEIENYSIEDYNAEDLERMRRRRERVCRMKREKERRLRIQRLVRLALPVIAVALILVISITALGIGKRAKAQTDNGGEQEGPVGDMTAGIVPVMDMPSGGASLEDITAGDAANAISGVNIAGVVSGSNVSGIAAGEKFPAESGMPTDRVSDKQYSARATDRTDVPPEEVNSTNVVFIDLTSGDILAQRDYKAVISPASMTKVLTVLVAAEHVEELDDTFTMTVDITDYSYFHDCSSVGFAVGEVVTVRDLFYGTILPSGGDAAVALATYVAGSHEAFVEMMNEKAKQLGLSDTAHFTNCVGLYDADHHCTVYDMAMIMEAALDNPLCREVLNSHIYTTSVTPDHPEGITVSNWFLRRIEDKDTGGEVLCAKTGYVSQSGNCAVSYGVDQSGRGYVCATTGAHSSWRCIYDHVALYKKYAQ